MRSVCSSSSLYFHGGNIFTLKIFQMKPSTMMSLHHFVCRNGPQSPIYNHPSTLRYHQIILWRMKVYIPLTSILGSIHLEELQTYALQSHTWNPYMLPSLFFKYFLLCCESLPRWHNLHCKPLNCNLVIKAI